MSIPVLDSGEAVASREDGSSEFDAPKLVRGVEIELVLAEIVAKFSGTTKTRAALPLRVGRRRPESISSPESSNSPIRGAT